MTSTVISTGLCIDKIEICLRFGKQNFDALNIFQHLLRELFLYPGIGKRIHRRRYENNPYAPLAVYIPLPPYRRQYLFVESGVATDWQGIKRTYAKFGFNASHIAKCPEAREMLVQTLGEIIPSGGYPVLLDDGYVLYAEFSIDYRGITSSSLDAFAPFLEQNLYYIRNNAIKTINLHDGKPGRPEQICIYDKKQADWERHWHLRRGPLTRIEAKRRLNRTQTYRELHLNELSRIPNPFAKLKVYERNRISQTFTAARHANFLRTAQNSGVQAALENTRGADRERRIRMLDDCRADWWNPNIAWEGVGNALQTALLL